MDDEALHFGAFVIVLGIVVLLLLQVFVFSNHFPKAFWLVTGVFGFLFGFVYKDKKAKQLEWKNNIALRKIF